MIILASRSPRRKELLKLITDEFEIVPSGFDESSITEPIPERMVRRLAQCKALEVQKRCKVEDIIIGCDTIVVSPGNEVFGIPRDEADAARMLRELSGKTHKVITGCCVLGRGKKSVFHKTTRVSFITLTEQDISWYLSTGEPFDKAGAYGVQGYAGVFVYKINGDFNNVVGMPVQSLRRILLNYK